MAALAAETAPSEPSLPDGRLAPLGLEAAQGKQSIHGKSLVDPAKRLLVTRALQRVVEIYGDPALATAEEREAAMLPQEGHVVLGSPFAA